MKQPTELLTFSSLPIGCELDDFPPLELPICYRIILSCAAVFMYDIALWPVFSEKPTEYLWWNERFVRLKEQKHMMLEEG